MSSTVQASGAAAAVTWSTTNSDDDQPQWLIQIRRTLEEEHEMEEEDTICITHVPKALMSCKPEAYIPQQVALGPYHYKRDELHESGRHKLAAAKRAQKHFFSSNNNATTGASLKFEDLVHNHMINLETRIRACYHGHLAFKPGTLSWILTIDASFLLELLQVCAIREGVNADPLPITSVSLTSSTSLLSSKFLSNNLGSSSGRRKSSDNVILRDIMMLENQVPLFILRRILEVRHSSLETADDVVYSMLIGLFKEISPIKMDEDYFLNIHQVSHCAHLLDFLYHMLVPPNYEVEEAAAAADDENSTSEFGEQDIEEGGKDGSNKVCVPVSESEQGPILQTLKKFFVSKPVTLVTKLIWKMISSIPGSDLLKKPIESMFNSSKELIKPEDDNNDEHHHHSKPPLMEEIDIPSVTELYNAGIRFLPTNGNIETIRFDKKTAILHLPIVCLDVNSDVILRNLVAYETSVASGPLVFTRYTEMMNGIIDTEEDAKLLREAGIVMNHLKTDEEVADLWNGMSKSVRLTKVPFLDEMIEDVNKYYRHRWSVKLKKFVNIYVFGSWRFLTFLATILLLLMTGLETFCTVYSCSKLFSIPGLPKP